MQVILDYPIEEVVDYIDWNPFFQVSSLNNAVYLLRWIKVCRCTLFSIN